MSLTTRRLYYEDPYGTREEALVLRTGEEEGRPFAVLDRTIFYPEGGGQPADRGAIGDAQVLDVQEREGEVRHYLSAPVPPGPVTIRLDWERRYDHMQQHTGQHLLTAVCAELHGWKTVGFHLGDADSTIDLEEVEHAVVRMPEVEARVNAAIRAAEPVRTRWVERGDLARLGIRSRGLPEGLEGPVRIVDIGAIDHNTCGGTHLRSTSELQMCRLLGWEGIRTDTRLHFLFGGRVLARLRDADARAVLLKERLTTGPEGFVAAVDRLLAEQADLRKRLKALEPLARKAALDAILALPGPLVVRHLPGEGASSLLAIAREATDARPATAVILLGEEAGRVPIVARAGSGFAGNLEAPFHLAVTALQGKGGGRGGAFSGSGPAPALVPIALAALERVSREPS